MKKYPKILLGCYLAAVLVFTAGCGSKNEDDLSAGGKTTKATAALGSAVISGKVILNGKGAAPAKIDMAADPVCKALHSTGVKDDSVLQNADGTLQNVFVYVKEGAGSYPSAPATVVLTQKGCVYEPHVLGLQVGQTLEIINDDATLHNVHCMAAANDTFNLGQPMQGMKSFKSFSKPEVMIKFKCDVHSWMHCFVGVLNHPFFGTTGADGAFQIKGLPAGSYTLEAWHEKYGTSTQKVDIKDGETKSITFTFEAK